MPLDELQNLSPRCCLPRRVGRLCLLALAMAALGACSTTSVVSIAGSAMSAGMAAAGIGKPASDTAPRLVRIRLDAARALNTTEDGQSLGLLVKLYQLRSGQAFSTSRADDLLDPARERAALGDDLVAVRELILTPGSQRILEEPLVEGAHTIAVAALFRAPAARRWRYAFDAAGSLESGIALGFHRCAITVGAGPIAGQPAASASAMTLAGVRCAEPLGPQREAGSTTTRQSG